MPLLVDPQSPHAAIVAIAFDASQPPAERARAFLTIAELSRQGHIAPRLAKAAYAEAVRLRLQAEKHKLLTQATITQLREALIPLSHTLRRGLAAQHTTSHS